MLLEMLYLEIHLRPPRADDERINARADRQPANRIEHRMFITYVTMFIRDAELVPSPQLPQCPKLRDSCLMTWLQAGTSPAN